MTPCKRGHIIGRRADGHCIQCALEKERRRYRKKNANARPFGAFGCRKGHTAGQYSDGHCIECRRNKMRQQYKTNPEKFRQRNRAFHLQKKYGITEEDYNTLAKEQGGVCAICEGEQEAKFHVDHDHDTKEVRGLLCARCNRMLGSALDNPDILRAGIAYLLKARKTRLKAA